MGQAEHRADIASISNAFPCVVTTRAAHGFSTHQFVRLTDLNGMIPIPRGMDQINNYRFRIVVTSDTTFTLEDPITFKAIDSTDYTPYVSGGEATLIQQDFVYEAEG